METSPGPTCLCCPALSWAGHPAPMDFVLPCAHSRPAPCSGGLAVPAWQLLLPACLPQQCSTVSHRTGALGAQPHQCQCLAGLFMLPHTHLTPVHFHSLWLAQGQPDGCHHGDHSHLQLWPRTWLKVAPIQKTSSLQENEAKPNPKPVLALFLLPECSQTNAQTRGAKSACSSSRTDIACAAQLHQDNFFSRTTCLKCEGQEHQCLCPCLLHSLTYKGPSSQQNGNNVQRCTRK